MKDMEICYTIFTFSPDDVVDWTGFWFSFAPTVVIFVEKTCRRGLCCFFVAIDVSLALFRLATVILFLLTGAKSVELNRLANRTELRVTERVWLVFLVVESVVVWLVNSVCTVVVPKKIFKWSLKSM
jgi:hypothetical protein